MMRMRWSSIPLKKHISLQRAFFFPCISFHLLCIPKGTINQPQFSPTLLQRKNAVVISAHFKGISFSFISLSPFPLYSLQTSLHGWQYMVDRPTSWCKRAFWSAIVSLSMCTAVGFLYNNTWNFVHSNVVTTVDTMTAPLSDVFFPSVVVCNINQVKKEEVKTYIPQLMFFFMATKNS